MKVTFLVFLQLLVTAQLLPADSVSYFIELSDGVMLGIFCIRLAASLVLTCSFSGPQDAGHDVKRMTGYRATKSNSIIEVAAFISVYQQTYLQAGGV